MNAEQKALFDKAAADNGGPDNVRSVETGHGFFVFRRPNRGEYKRAINAGSLFAMQSNTFPDAVEMLARCTNVVPGPEQFDAILERCPAVHMMAAPALLELAGIQSAAEKKG